jgi:hypothetical protein
MKAFVRTTLGLIAGASIFAVSTLELSSEAVAANAVRLAGTQITKILSGNSVRQVNDQYRAYFASNGSIEASYVNISQRGTWQVRDHMLCQRWQEWAAGKTQCYQVYQGQGGAYRFDNGKGEGFNFVLRKGRVLSK